MAVIGAGMGGLAAAIDLAVRGLHVTVIERASAPGGKMRQVFVAERPIDAGPTVFTMRWVFEALFTQAGESLSDHLVLRPATTLARHAWQGGDQLDLFADRARSADAIGAFAGPQAARGYLAFCKEARSIYEALERPHIQSARPGMTSLVRQVGLLQALRLKPYDVLWAELGKHFADPRLQQLFGRYATYCGTSPFQAPATLMLVAHVEQEGVWFIEGGMHRLAVAMETIARRQGVAFRYDCHVSEVMVASGRACGVRLGDGGEVIPADAVILNGEPSALGAGLLGAAAAGAAPPPLRFPQRSLSAATWAVLATTTGTPLLRHTVCFSSDYAQEFKLIGAGMLPTEPTTYICAQDRADLDDAPPDGPERLLILVNAPASGDRRAFSQAEIDQCMQGVSGLLRRCGIAITPTEPPVLTTPAMYNRLYPASGGALYGQAVLVGAAGLKRPDNRTKLNRLYLAGGSTHPGAGVPMAALSGRQAALRVIEDLSPPPATGLFRRTAASGSHPSTSAA